MNIGILALTTGGRKLAATIADRLANCRIIPVDKNIAQTFRNNWQKYDGFIAIMATGITIRSIAPLLNDKEHDPAVIGLDEKGCHVISLLSGHLGGGNALARKVADLTGGQAVITTASDTLELAPLDLWAKAQDLRYNDRDILTRASSILVNTGRLKIFSEVEIEALPPGLIKVENLDEADLAISHRSLTDDGPVLHPNNLVVGVGCNRGTPAEEFAEALEELFADLGFSTLAIRNLASIDAKNDEKGLLHFAKDNSWPIAFFDRDEINTVANVAVSSAALKAVGAQGVAEPTALLSAQTTILLSRKRKWQNVTMAVAKAPCTLSAQVLEHLNI
ncbi:MAG: cobalamin biosynthesis protein [Desulfocapsaceae bacterium]|nr:cobalamin biosynthesis protein [Desulfocapsaceae bacterium]